MPDPGTPGVRKTRTRKPRTAPLAAAVTAGALDGHPAGRPAFTVQGRGDTGGSRPGSGRGPRSVPASVGTAR
ncbi:hypothetical protein [Streptosporangium sp. NPDC002524]|uniref:hypothetical protein n=1 Tax=Streptosporangium sp. NPDC002524 TaxID=3154537 RepID=UPI0033199751